MNKKVLLIEDEKPLRDILSDKLEQSGFEVITAADGDEGLQKLKENKPALILLDIILPKIDGFAVLKEIAGHKEWKKIPVVMITNLGQKKDVDKGIRLGAKEYIIKANFMPDDIIEVVRRYLTN